MPKRARGFRKGIDRTDMRRHLAGGQQVAEFVLIASEFVWRDVLELKSQQVHALDENEVQWDAGDDARGVADGDEPAAGSSPLFSYDDDPDAAGWKRWGCGTTSCSRKASASMRKGRCR